ncbi:unnamed protein product [Pieris brassicae]|uniref:Uncharacterized protein n=1 Tax=Pieris brassicae TaxID=7116 RepID=A0A9P0SQI3_PIEBR|nr:unnamed protein product [Pieris brassicae]
MYIPVDLDVSKAERSRVALGPKHSARTHILNKNSTLFAQECTARLFLVVRRARGRRRRLVSVCRGLPPITEITSPAGVTWPRGDLAHAACPYLSSQKETGLKFRGKIVHKEVVDFSYRKFV